jgi:hypothetical protein
MAHKKYQGVAVLTDDELLAELAKTWEPLREFT